MGLELAEQLNWELPDAIFYPTGGGTGLIGMWKAFQELAALGWLESEISKHYEITIQPRIGPGPTDAKEGRPLNRVIRWLEGSIGYEADLRQAERLRAECGLEGSKGVATPGVKATFHELEQDTELAARPHTASRGAAARWNYLSADRIDAQFAAKEVCRWMSSPTGKS